MADNAQLLIGKSYMLDNKYEEAAAAFEKLIRAYPAADTVAEAYYQSGLALQHLSVTASDAAAKRELAGKAVEAFKTAATKYPDTDAALLAKQKLTETSKPE
jgi:outer membrane protein assembly factor BamD (BamD/ComL family)